MHRSGSIWKAATRLLVLLGGLCLATAGWAEDEASPADSAAPVVAGDPDTTVILPGSGEKIVYDPASKSYFQLHSFSLSESRGGEANGNWNDAQRVANNLSFKGVSGRLAIVKTPEVHDFLLRNFRSIGANVAWIGMKVDCKSMKAYWTDGTPVDKQAFNAWDLKRWYRTNVNCMQNTSIAWMGVYYEPAEDGFRWQASGPQKAFRHMFVEYPTGKP